MAFFFARTVLLSALLIHTTLAQGPDFSPPIFRPKITPGCTLSSFTTPSWYIQDFQSISGNASFSLLNRATNASVSLSCQSGTCQAAAARLDPSLLVTLQESAAEAKLYINQTWSCNDRNLTTPITFSANANATVDLACDGNKCKAEHPMVLAKGSLYAPISVTPSYAQGPDGHAQKGCSTASMHPSWDIVDVDFLYLYGDGEEELPYAAITLKIVNPALAFEAPCIGFLADPPAMIPRLFDCSGNSLDATGRNRYRARTATLFDPATLQLSINSTWYCDDIDPAEPQIISASGNLILPVPCTNTTDNAGRRTYHCSQPETQKITIPGTLLSTTPLPPYSIEDPLPVPDGCTVSSILAPAFTLSGFAQERNASAGTDYVGFLVKLRTDADAPGSFGASDPVFVSAGPPPAPPPMAGMDMGTGAAPTGVRVGTRAVVVGEAWRKCEFLVGMYPTIPSGCEFRYDAVTNVLDLKADWICSDLDNAHPIVFSGISSTKVPSPSCTTEKGDTSCSTEEGVTWTAQVSNVTWHMQ